MGKGSKAPPTPPNQQVTTTTSNLPEYAQPYFENLLQRGQAESYRQYQPYEAERLAGFTPNQLATQQETMGMQTPGQFGLGTGMAGSGGLSSLSAGQQFFGMAADPNIQQAFMSPYQQSVTDVAKKAAIRDAQMAQQQINLGAVRQGTYGGARQALAQGERERGLLDRLSGIQAEGSQKAFEDARRVQQFGSDLGLRGIGQGIQAGQTLGQLGQAQQEADLRRLTAQESVGGQQRDFEQQKLDQQYADFLRQRDYPMEQLGYYSNLLRGLPMQMGSTQTTYAPPPSMVSQIGGLGLAGLGLAGAARTVGFAEGGEVSSYALGGGVMSPEELDSMTNRLSDAQLQTALRSTKPGSYENLMAAGELQTRDNVRKAAMAKQGGQQPVIADLLTGGAMPQMPQQMPQMPPEMQQQMPQQVAMLPENAGGVAALPAPNMDNIATMAAGGMVAFDDGGSVARFDVGGNVSLTDVLRTLNMDERRSYQQTGRLPPRAQAMLTGQAALPAAPTPFAATQALMAPDTGTGPATVTMAADPNAPAQRPLPEGVRFYPGTSRLLDGQAANVAPTNLFQQGMSQSSTSEPVPGSLPADVRRADSSEMARTAPPAAPAAPGGLDAIAKRDADAKAAAATTAPQTSEGLGFIDALKRVQKDVGDKLSALGDPFADIREDVKKASAERKGEIKQSMFMRIAEFGLGMAAGTSPFALVNAGKAGIEALKGLGDDLRERKKLDREDRKLLADIKRLEVADKRDNILKVGDMSMKIIGEMGTENRAKLAADTQLIIAREGDQSRERISGQSLAQTKLTGQEARDDRLITAANEQAQKIVQNDKRSLGRTAAENDAEVERLFGILLSRARAARDNKGVDAPPPRAAGKLVGNTYVLPTGR